ncbi:sugar ABC transporter permease [Streptomyces sp. H10-C2]|uniref:carbohydrate ABC transporter permease n=1 Tax=unclassified Streptomyces TaxID=2593676 RepID=UPI0024B94F92|nr:MULTISPECIES: sugar ABC transporter permease [unclassified Streptomyces]MDJ0344687.1 sugar ABC transporter permease [Streptomyces sp. PH10-H1]MDJ0372829.1 sugar ABC transporter permease [Streptomyces sp. H10-C2]
MQHRKYPFIVGFLIVPLVLYITFVVWPYIQTFGYSLTDWSGQSQTFNFVGLDNYTALFHDDVFVTALEHNILLLIFLPVITILLALFFAFMVNVGGRETAGGVQGVRGAGFYKIVYFFPQVLSVAILIVLFGAVYRSDGAGLLNGFLLKLHLIDAAHPVEWLNDPNLVLWCLLAVQVWAGVGFYLVLFSAAMTSIPKDIYEAALLDGAGRSQTFFKVTLPLLWDSIQTSWVYISIFAMDFFALVSGLTTGTGYGGGPDHHSEVMATYLMRNFLFFGKSGYACAQGVIMMLLTLIVSAVTLRASRRDRIEF